MRKTRKSRKSLFGAALKLEGVTVEQWVRQQPNEKSGGTGVSTAHLYDVLNGKRVSAPLLARIDAVIRRHFGDVLAA